MRNKLTPPYYINRVSKWAPGLVSWIPLTFTTQSLKTNNTLYLEDILNKTFYFFNDGADSNLIANLNGPNNEPINTFKITDSDYIESNSTISRLQMDNGITLSFWIYYYNRPTLLGYTEFLYQFTNGIYNLKFGLSDSKIRLEYFGYADQPSITVQQYTWNHILATIDTNGSKIYYNGDLLSTYTNLIENLNITGTSKLSPIAYASTYDLKIYNYAWAEDQVKTYYNSSRERKDLFGQKRFPGLPSVIPFISNGINLHTINIATNTNTIDLLVSGQPVPNSGNMDLLVRGHEISYESQNLNILGHDVSNNSIDLYIRGYSTLSNSFDLYNHAVLYGSGNTDLYSFSIDTKNDSINLFIKTPNGIPINQELDLYINSTVVPQIFNTQNLYIKNTQAFDPRNSVNLTIAGPTGFESDNVYLFIQNQDDISNRIDLYVNGPNFLQASGMDLYITTPNGGGDSDGYIPINDSVDLFIARNSESTASIINLFIKSPEPLSSGVTLYSHGTYLFNEDINLFTYGSGIPQPINNNVGFYIRGGV
jgi:hypothetical protein